jgi:hypothetical protein
MGSMMSRARPSCPQTRKVVVAALATLTRGKVLFSDWLRRLLQARKRRNEQESEFYRKLGAYCRANNLSPICEDDWKSAAYIGNGDRTTDAKGDVLWTKANLHR